MNSCRSLGNRLGPMVTPTTNVQSRRKFPAEGLIRRPSLKSRLPDDRCPEVFQIYAQIPSLNLEKDELQGICIDIGALKSVTRTQQAEAYASSRGEALEIRQNDTPRVFVFGETRRASLRSMEVGIPLCDVQGLKYRNDILHAPIPMLLGLHVLDKYAIFANTVTNELIFAREG